MSCYMYVGTPEAYRIVPLLLWWTETQFGERKLPSRNVAYGFSFCGQLLEASVMDRMSDLCLLTAL